MRYGIGLKLGLLLTSFSLAAMGIVGYYSYASGRAALLAAAQVLGRNFQANIDSVARDAVLLAGLQASRVIVDGKERTFLAGSDLDHWQERQRGDPC